MQVWFSKFIRGACVLCPLLYIRFWADDLSVQPIEHTD